MIKKTMYVDLNNTYKQFFISLIFLMTSLETWLKLVLNFQISQYSFLIKIVNFFNFAHKRSLQCFVLNPAWLRSQKRFLATVPAWWVLIRTKPVVGLSRMLLLLIVRWSLLFIYKCLLIIYLFYKYFLYHFLYVSYITVSYETLLYPYLKEWLKLG